MTNSFPVTFMKNEARMRMCKKRIETLLVFLSFLFSFSVAAFSQDRPVYRIVVAEPEKAVSNVKHRVDESYSEFLREELETLSDDRHCECCILLETDETALEELKDAIADMYSDFHDPAGQVELGKWKSPNYYLKLKVSIRSNTLYMRLIGIDMRTSVKRKSGTKSVQVKGPVFDKVDQGKLEDALRDIFDEVIRCESTDEDEDEDEDDIGEKPREKKFMIETFKLLHYNPGAFLHDDSISRLKYVAKWIQEKSTEGFKLEKVRLRGFADGIRNLGLSGLHLATPNCLEDDIGSLTGEAADGALATLRACEVEQLLSKLYDGLIIDYLAPFNEPEGGVKSGFMRGVEIEVVVRRIE